MQHRSVNSATALINQQAKNAALLPAMLHPLLALAQARQGALLGVVLARR